MEKLTDEQIHEYFESKDASELAELKNQIELMANYKANKEIMDAYEGMIQTSKELGYDSLEAFITDAESKSQKTKQAKRKKKTVDARYRDIDNKDDTWTGRGKQPRWLVKRLEEGYKLTDFLIDPPSETEEAGQEQ